MIKKNKIIKTKSSSSRTKCEGCGKAMRIRNIIFFKGKYLCSNCRSKLPEYREITSISCVINCKHRLELKDAVKRSYKVKMYKSKKNSLSAYCYLTVPLCYEGLKVKVIPI